MLNTLNINLKTDIKTDRPTALGIKLMSQDKNNNRFILRFTNGGEPVNLDDTYTVEILTKFQNSGASRLTSATVRQDYATWQFDTEYITQDEMVYNYVYVRKAGSLVVSADANAFYFDVGLSEIDKDAGRVAEVYDENYQKYLDEFKDNVDFEEIAQAEQARKEAELLREENYEQLIDTAIVEADVVEKVDNKVTELTPQINNLTAQLAQTTYNPSLYNIKSGGEIDISDGLQDLLTFIKDDALKKITIPYGVYKMTSPVYLPDNITIDFSGSKILWRGINDINNIDRDIGIFNVRGEILSVHNIIDFKPKEELFNKPLEGASDSFVSSRIVSKVKVDGGVFEIGDYVDIEITTGENTKDTLKPIALSFCKILDIVDGYLILDYFSPYDWEEHVFEKAILRKIKPAKSVVVKNFFIKDEINAPANYSAIRNTFVAGVSFKYAIDCTAKKIEGFNTKFPLLMLRGVHNFCGRNIKLDTPNILNGGEGYNTQIVNSNKVILEDIISNKERHNVDISGGAFFNIKRAVSHLPKHTAIDMHGLGEHSIVWEDCIGHASLSNGITYFPCITHNVLFRNHVGAVTVGGEDSYADELKFINGRVRLLNFHPLNVSFNDTEITWDTESSNYNLFPNKRGTNKRSSFVVNGCSLQIVGTGGIGVVSVLYDTFKLKNSLLTESLKIAERNQLVFRDTSTVELSKNKIENIDTFVFKKITLERKNIYINIDDNVYSFKSNKAVRSLLEIQDMKEVDLFVDFRNNKLLYQHDGYLTYLLINEVNDSYMNSNFFISDKNNQLIGEKTGTIRAYLKKESAGSLSHNRMGNIIKNYSGTAIDQTFNKIIL